MYLPCGFCGRPVYALDLYSHAMANHQNHVVYLVEESKKAALNSGGYTCNVKPGGVRCGKEAFLVGGVRVHTLIRATMLNNPTQGPNVDVNSHQLFCIDHAKAMTARDMITMLVADEWIKQEVGQRGYAVDEMWRNPENPLGPMGPELLWYPILREVPGAVGPQSN